MDQDQAATLWQLEQQFWTGSAAFYEGQLAPEALMVLPEPVGVLDRAATVASISAAPRWRSVSFAEQRCVFPGADAAVLAYLAHGDRGGGSAYAARCSSTYVRHEDQWLLALHHQSALGRHA